MSDRPTVLLFGARGQLGIEVQRSVPDDVTLVALDRSAGDITDPALVAGLFATHAPTFAINAAAYTAVDRAESEPDAAAAANAQGPALLAASCAAHGVRLLHVSTDFVFDGTRASPYPPDAVTRPLGVYGLTKRDGEQRVLASGADALILRTGWVYAAHGGNFVNTMLRLMAERPALTVVEDQIGTPTWAAGLAQVVWALLRHPGCFGIYHWSDAGACSWYDFALAIREEAQALGLLAADCATVAPIPASGYPTPARRPAYSVLDKSRTREALGSDGDHWRVQLRRMLVEVQTGAN